MGSRFHSSVSERAAKAATNAVRDSFLSCAWSPRELLVWGDTFREVALKSDLVRLSVTRDTDTLAQAINVENPLS